MSKTLQEKNTRYLFARLLVILAAASVLFYVLMRMQARHMQHKQLELHQLNIWNAFAQQEGRFPMDVPAEYHIAPTTATAGEAADDIRDTAFYIAGKGSVLPFKQMTRSYSLSGRQYRLTTYVSSEEIDHLIIKVFITEAFLLALLFVAIIYLNRKTSQALWQPFRDTLQRLTAFDITAGQPPGLPEHTGIHEFDELNAVATDLITKVNRAYYNQRQFVENASHEIQTPLAIIRSKLELLINQPGITEKVAELLADITDANDRLSLMNRNLLLLAKIDNNQFPEKASINMSDLLHKILNSYRNYHEETLPSITESIEKRVMVTANPSLMEVLLNNLVKNAIIHNIPSGHMEVTLQANGLTIVNTGPPPAFDPGLMFERFKKGSDAVKSSGLGLALARQICGLYGFGISLEYDNGVYQTRLITS